MLYECLSSWQKPIAALLCEQLITGQGWIITPCTNGNPVSSLPRTSYFIGPWWKRWIQGPLSGGVHRESYWFTHLWRCFCFFIWLFTNTEKRCLALSCLSVKGWTGAIQRWIWDALETSWQLPKLWKPPGAPVFSCLHDKRLIEIRNFRANFEYVRYCMVGHRSNPTHTTHLERVVCG